MALTIGQIAALIHKDMCEDAANGYSWSPRWGEDGLGVKTLTIEGRKYRYDRGSYDCATSVTVAWQAVLDGTRYANALDAATYTGDLAAAFLASGLFSRKPMSFIADPGDLYLNTADHVAMCQTQTPDVLSEFSINENGEVYGGEVGDQTGWESHLCDYYDFPWDCIIHAKQVTIADILGKSEVKQPEYRVFRGGKWQAWHSNGKNAGSAGKPIYDIDFKGLTPKSWWRLTLEGGKVLKKNTHNEAHKLPIIGIEVYYDTENPKATGYYEALYRAHVIGGGWLKWEHDTDDGGAGDDRHAIDVIAFKLRKC